LSTFKKPEGRGEQHNIPVQREQAGEQQIQRKRNVSEHCSKLCQIPQKYITACEIRKYLHCSKLNSQVRTN